MSFKTALGKIIDRLSDVFAVESQLPEPPVQKAMEKDGWKFHVHYPTLYGAFAMPLEFAATPEGRPAIGDTAIPEDHQRYLKTVAEKRQQMGLTP